MSLYKIQGKAERQKGIYYEFNSEDTPLGEGGMGKVYKGRCVDESTGKSRDVAVKFMYSDLPPYAIEKARREASIQFRHPNLVEMLGFIETESRSPIGETVHHYHVVSELLVGVSLDSLFEGKLTDQQGHVVPFAEKLYKDYQQDPNHFAIEIVKNVLSGLMAMHDAGYIHRDIDPTNIMITADGHIKLIDFGIAKKMNSLTTHDKHLTQAGQFVGKPEYAAPELVLGAINEQNQTTDIYAVGILLFQCIVGHVPFEGDRTDILQKQIHSPLPLNLVKDKGLRKIIAKATEKSRSKRFQSAAEFRVAIDQLNLTRNTRRSFTWPSVHINWKYVEYVAIAVICLGVLRMPHSIKEKISRTVLQVFREDSQKEKSSSITEMMQQTAQSRPLTYDKAVAELHDARTATKGMTHLQTLSDSGNADASFLLSRLYFRSKLQDDYCPDSIRALQAQLSVTGDNARAFRLLQQSIRQNPRNYQALFELACDYWKAGQRTEAVGERQGERADTLFHQARTYAAEAGDQFYVGMIDTYLAAVKQWKENLRLINQGR